MSRPAAKQQQKGSIFRSSSCRVVSRLVERSHAIANATPYGLSASVWTNDLRRAHRVSARLEVGMVWVNTWLLRDLRVPFGGVKQSGVGREGGRWSLEFFSQSKNVCIRTEAP